MGVRAWVVAAVLVSVTVSSTAGCDTLTSTGPATAAHQATASADRTPSVGSTSGTVGSTSGTPPAGPTGPRPAPLAGGACLLLDFDVIRSTLGTTFDVAASADTSGSYSCVVQSAAANLPDMVLSISTTDLSPAEFTANAEPAGATSVSSLGKIGYEIVHAATTSAGPVIEVGWLSGNERLIMLSYACAKDLANADVTTLAAKMIAMARTVDATTV